MSLNKANQSTVVVDDEVVKSALSKTLRAQARQSLQAGDFEKSAFMLQQLIDMGDLYSNISDKDSLVLCLYTLGRYNEMVSVLESLSKAQPNDIEAQVNLALGYINVKKINEAQQLAQEVLKRLDETVSDEVTIKLYEALCQVSVQLNDWPQATDFACRSIMTKVNATSKYNTELHFLKPPIFNPHDASKNIIAYSLWGDKALYCDGAVANASIAPLLFPEWRCRFYCDSSVPDTVINQLLQYGADVIIMPDQTVAFEGLFWRFQAANDPSVERFLIRDADSLLSIREREAVLAWLDSDKPFHMMRDFYTHTALIMAGMWGGCSGMLPNITEVSSAYLRASGKDRTIDQRFLEREIWPCIKHHLLIHDDLLGCLDAQKFPDSAYIASGQHVGQRYKQTSKRGTLVKRFELFNTKNAKL